MLLEALPPSVAFYLPIYRGVNAGHMPAALLLEQGKPGRNCTTDDLPLVYIAQEQLSRLANLLELMS